MPPQYARQTAVPCTLAELQNGQWIQSTDSSGVNTSRGFVSRTSVLGVMVSKQDDSSFIIEDGTGKFSVRLFDTKTVYANVGDLVHVIGRPREYNGERYVALEICKRLRSPLWIQYRRKELSFREDIPVKEEVKINVVENPIELIINRIRELDQGPGVTVDELINIAPNAEAHIKTLLEEGEIFEIRPGRVKVLE